MGDFHIRGRIEAYGPSSFAAIAVAIPASGTEPFRRKQAVCRSRAQAVTRLRELAVELGAEMRDDGHAILEVLTDD